MQFIPKRKRDAGSRGVESLETRSLLSASPLANVGDVDPADTLDQASQLGVLTSAQVNSTIGDGADVDWFAFTLQFPSTVTLTGTGATFGLYDSAETPASDPLGSVGYRLLTQGSADGSDPTTLTRNLAAGTYYVAVSGLGNSFFHPLIAHSGIPGEAGDYTFEITSTQIDTSGSADPLALSVDASALGFRVDLSDALNFAPTVALFTDNGTPLSVATVQFNAATNDLVVVPTSPLTPGHYRAEVRDTLGNLRLSVEVDVPDTVSSESGTQGNDTAATADDLGELTGAGLVQVNGVIGDDPYYRLVTQSRNQFAGNDVDLYHFHITASGTVGFQAEVFAGRIGSSLDAGLTLYRLNPVTGSLEYVSGNNNSLNLLTVAGNNTPLYTDPVMTQGLTAGDYYLAVSHGLNSIAPAGSPVFGNLNPAQAHSGSNGTNVGAYVLNVQVVPLGTQPEVKNVSIADGAEFPSAPTNFAVQFSQFVDLTSDAYASLSTSSRGTVPGVFVRDARGRTYYPNLQSFNPETFEARFTMQDRLPPGHYELHLSGNLGVTDLQGNPLKGNSASGDYVVSFDVDRNAVGTNGNPRLWTHDPHTDETNEPQQLGALFPQELVAGVDIDRPVSKSKARGVDYADDYKFSVTEAGTYVFRLSGLQSNGLHLTLTDANGNTLDPATDDGGRTLFVRLNASEYTVHVTSAGGIRLPILSYHVTIVRIDVQGNAPPLSMGPAPTVGMKLSGMSDIPGGGGSTPGSGPSGPIGGGTRPGSVGSGSSGVSGPVNATSSGYISLRYGLPQLNLVDGQPNSITAIPTVTNQSGTASGLIFRANRLVRGGLAERETMSQRGISELADGPIGRNRPLGGLLNRSDASGHSLQALISSTLSDDRNVADDQSPANQENRSSRTDERPGDETVDGTAGESITSSDRAEDNDANHSVSRERMQQDPSLILDAISMLYDTRSSAVAETVAVEQTLAGEDWNADAALIVSAEESSSFQTPAAAVELNDAAQPTQLTDKLFAVGLGLLLSDLFLPRSSEFKGSDSIGPRHRQSSRRAARLSELLEDPGA